MGVPAPAVRPVAASPITSLTAWLADIPRQLGTRLFLTSDEEAYWRGWQITERWGGLARCYRDARFEPHAARGDRRAV